MASAISAPIYSRVALHWSSRSLSWLSNNLDLLVEGPFPMDNVCIPMHLDAFALSPACCDGESRIAPYTQPNYTALRLDNHLIQHDVLDHVDFHNTSPASKNPRLADLGVKPPNNLKSNRMGVHLHWSLPRFYRTGSASSTSSQAGSADPSNPVFPKIPNRWLVTRHIKNHQPSNALPEFQSWVVESNAVRYLTEIGDDVDLESEVAPFVSYEGDPNLDRILEAQSEVFLGQKFDLAGWKEPSASKHQPLTLMNSSNPLFPDYALHNTNVLSVLDNFSFKKNPGDKDFQYASAVQCDYFVVGWHQDSSEDPLNSPVEADLTSRLSNLMLQLDSQSAKDYGGNENKTRCLLYGAIYDVKYDSTKKPDSSVAETSAMNFTKPVKMEPLSVGTTPLDGILTFLDAHQSDADSIFGTAHGTGNTLAEDITGLAQFLYATADEYDARVQAQDLMAHQSFAKADGGFKWSYAKASTAGDTPAVPSTSEAQALRTLNEAQVKLDACNRQLTSLQWELFAEWWKYVSEYIPELQQPARQAYYTTIVTGITKAIWGEDQKSGLLATITSLKNQIAGMQSDLYKSSVRDPFFTRTDPTLCIAGLDSGRPQDFLDPLTVLLDHELSSDTTAVPPIFVGAANPVPADNGLQATAVKLLAQCLKNSNTQNGVTSVPQTTGFQAWGDRNPFVPLFIEWESMYYHVDIGKWDISLQSTPWGHNHSYVRYAPTGMLSGDTSNQTDFRSLSGRILVLPQPVFSLENIVTSILDNPPAGMTLAPGEEDFIRQNIRDMKFISAPLSGLTSNLLTQCEGAHVQPVVRVQGQQIQPLGAAATKSGDIGISADVLQLMGTQTGLTPYADLMSFGTDEYPKDKYPFKPVTHGQMLFTKLNIVDKFGQAICLPSPRPRLRNEPQPPDAKIYPCLSDYLAPDVIGTAVNTVFPTADPVQPGQIPPCEYVQLPPSINQDARINGAFLTQDTISPGVYSAWREVTDYENPIWGWIVINYADSGLQFFLADGTFYREIRVGGPAGQTVSPKWLPNDPPALTPTDAATAQLDLLIAKLSPDIDTNGTYLQSFSDMINGSILNMPFPPSDYSGYANAIVGKPLALVNAGWSIELAAPALKPQNTLGNATKDAQADLEAYSFPLKIGDIERSYDGVVGYYLSSNSPPATPTTNWEILYTYFLPTPNSKFQDISQPSKSILPNLNPYWLDPSTPDLTSAHATKYTVTSMLVDPYTKINAFSPILPTKSLTLPPWTVQAAFQKMHAFFHLGPNLSTQDVPRSLAEAKVPGTLIKMPVSGNKGTWSWFQPYVTTDSTHLDPEYAEIDVQEDLVGEKLAKGPYTFLEGYLQLMGNLQGKSS